MRNDMKLTALAVAIALTLGTAAGFAQEPDPAQSQQPPSSELPSSQQPSSQLPSSQLPSSQQPSSQLPSSQLPSSQQPGIGQAPEQQPGLGEPAESPEPSADFERESGSAEIGVDDELGAASEGAEKFDKLVTEHADLGKFAEAVKTAGLADSLTEGTEYTVFAPTDDAWTKKTGKNIDELMQPENREELVSLLRAHIVADDVDMNLASAIDKAKTIDGGEVDITSENGELMVGDAKAVDAEGIEMDSLRIYPIDGVLASNAPLSGAFDEPSNELSDDPSSVEDPGQGRPSDTFDEPGADAPLESPQPGDDLERETDPLRPDSPESPIGPQSEPERPGGNQLERQ